MTPSGVKAINRLKEGNLRFSNPEMEGEFHEIPPQSFKDLSAGQKPFAAIMACSDSRVPVETIFSQGAGSLFVIRVAGNVVGPTQLGSLEFAVAELGVPLVLVMGHSGCGAIQAALAASEGGVPADLSQKGHLHAVLEPIIDVLGRKSPSKLRDGSLDPDEAVRLNVIGACEDLIHGSDLLASKVDSGEILVAGSVYDLGTGRVDFL